MDIVLYYAPVACSLVPYVTLTEAKAKFTVHPMNLRKGQQNSDDYLRLNPKHKVPLLVIDGKPLTENVAIQQWIARSFPASCDASSALHTSPVSLEVAVLGAELLPRLRAG